jgi:N-acetyl-anhydromuramyl-L-alanine amidase AmpD
MPNIRRQLTARHYTQRKSAIRGIVLHDTFGSGTHNDTLYLANPSDNRAVSADFTVEKDGSIWQLNPDVRRYATFHAGRATNFKGITNAAVNHATIGIEIVQSQKAVNYTEAQIRSVAELCKMLCSQYGLAASDITTHKQIITDGSRTDPRNFPFEKFWQYFGNSSYFQSSSTFNYAYIAIAFVFVILVLDD